jgi:hypothetical protein
MAGIEVERVVAAVEDLLSRGRAAA